MPVGPQPFRVVHIEFETVGVGGGGHPVADCCYAASRTCHGQICVICSTAEIQLIIISGRM